MFALSPTARAVTPAPDGGYPNNNTAEGDNALFSLTTGSRQHGQSVLMRSLATQPAATTRPTVLMRSHRNTTGNYNTATVLMRS